MSGTPCGAYSRWGTLLAALAASLTVSLFTLGTAGPVDAAASSSIEAEAMNRSSTSSKIFSDSMASGGQALKLLKNGTASTEFYGNSDEVVVRARGDQCRGAPRMVVKVDGVQRLSTVVSSRQWTDYIASIPPSDGKHTLAISFTNDRRTRKCDRNLRLDKVSFVASSGENAPAGFVTRSGTNFILNSKLFRFVGTNMYNAAGDPGIYECGPWMQNPDEELDDWFSRFKRDSSGQIIRFWAYQSYTNGGTDWSAFDRVMRLANKYGVKVIPVLENQWVECSEGGYKYDTWYGDGYLRPYGSYPLSYKEYVQRVVERYKDEPAIAAWMLMNEAESKTNTDAENAEALYSFTRDMSAFVKSLDQNHLVTLGSIGTGQPGVSGSNYQLLYSLPTLDFMEFHDYNANDEAMPGAGNTKAPLHTTIFTQDNGWKWSQQLEGGEVENGYRQNKARAWETFSATVPSGAEPFQRIGINVYGDLVGDVYIDEVRIGSRVYGFEDGTTQGFQSSPNIQLSNASSIAYAGSRSLKLAVSKPGGEQVWVPATSADHPGTEVSVLMYVDDCGMATLVAAMCTSKELNKPILVGEAGMTTCGSYNGSQLETPESRATKFDAKIGAFFKEGGAGYLIWAWDPKSSCSTDFTSGDPLNAVLAKYAANP